ncbi:hypothetical protein OAP18_01310 [Gammaproteobacteria bacterium]|nr:hypothetical protein [Gammaproteobacteria bacterium]
MKIILIATLLFLNTGCSIALISQFINRTSNPVVVFAEGDFQGGALKVASSSESQLSSMYGKCFTVVDSEELLFFDRSGINYSEVAKEGSWARRIIFTYENKQLYLLGVNGEQIELPRVSSCEGI